MNAAASQDTPLVGIIMGSQSDWATLEHTANMLKQLGVPFEAEVVSAHRTPDRLFEYAETARDRGIQVIIAGAGGAAFTRECVRRKLIYLFWCASEIFDFKWCRFIVSIVQMPAGIAVGTLAIGPAGATNAAIMAAQILGLTRPEIAKNVADFRAAQTDKVASNNIPGQA
jgi:5-(carboxyamino)imidazole ribonucleotide mutase